MGTRLRKGFSCERRYQSAVLHGGSGELQPRTFRRHRVAPLAGSGTNRIGASEEDAFPRTRPLSAVCYRVCVDSCERSIGSSIQVIHHDSRISPSAFGVSTSGPILAGAEKELN